MDFRRLLRITFRVILSLVLALVIYFLAAVCLSWLSVNSDAVECKENPIEIFLVTNGVHTDIVLPLKNEYKDWSMSVDPYETRAGGRNIKYVAFGWGDRGFYLDTPTWADLKFSTAANALFYLGSSIMHVTFYRGPREGENCRKVCISKGSYQKIVEYVENSFAEESPGKYTLIKNAGYGASDLFYNAKGTYGLFYTCNTWTNNALKAGELKACVWTPFDKGIFHQYKPAKK